MVNLFYLSSLITHGVKLAIWASYTAGILAAALNYLVELLHRKKVAASPYTGGGGGGGGGGPPL